MTTTELSQDIYDLINSAFIPLIENDGIKSYRIQFEKEAKDRIKKELKSKRIEVTGNTIIIGERKPIKITITKG